MRRIVAWLVIGALVGSGCSRAVVVPREDYDRAASDSGIHRVDMHDGSYYLVLRFAMTDSAVVVRKLYASDPRFNRHPRLPISLARQDVVSISRVETNWIKTGVVLAGVVGVISLAVWALVDAFATETK
jgi:hypothetical protein